MSAATPPSSRADIGGVLSKAAAKLGGWNPDDILTEISLGSLGADGDAARLRIDMYFIDRERREVVAVELKCPENLADVIDSTRPT